MVYALPISIFDTIALLFLYYKCVFRRGYFLGNNRPEGQYWTGSGYFPLTTPFFKVRTQEGSQMDLFIQPYFLILLHVVFATD